MDGPAFFENINVIEKCRNIKIRFLHFALKKPWMDFFNNLLAASCKIAKQQHQSVD